MSYTLEDIMGYYCSGGAIETHLPEPTKCNKCNLEFMDIKTHKCSDRDYYCCLCYRHVPNTVEGKYIHMKSEGHKLAILRTTLERGSVARLFIDFLTEDHSKRRLEELKPEFHKRCNWEYNSFIELESRLSKGNYR